MFDCCAVITPSLTPTATVYLNGGSAQTTSSGGGTISTPTAPTIIQICGPQKVIGNVVMLWGRALTATEVANLNLGPYQLFIPAGEYEMETLPLPPVFSLMPQILW
jgi:hypothetical protein